MSTSTPTFSPPPPPAAPSPPPTSGRGAHRLRVVQRVFERWDRWLKAFLPQGLSGAATWLFLAFFLFWGVRLLSGPWSNLFLLLQLLDLLVLLALAVPLLWRFIQRRLLWSLSSRLILTYLLFGLAPIVLFGTLVFFVSYLAAGQFAIHLADSRLQAELTQMSTANAHRLSRMVLALQSQPQAQLQTRAAQISAAKTPDGSTHIDPSTLFPEGEGPNSEALEPILGDLGDLGNSPRPRLQRHTSIFLDCAPLLYTPAGQQETRVPLGLPPWASELSTGHFSGLVLDGGSLFLVSLDQHAVDLGPSHAASRLTFEDSVLVDEPLMSIEASGLGRVDLTPEKTATAGSAATVLPRAVAPRAIANGTLPEPANLIDIPVRFHSTLKIVDWDNQQSIDVPIEVITRPSLLSRQLFGGSLGGIYTSAYLILLVALIILFALIEILALCLALRVSHSITSSVADLYAATQHIDRGDLNHRIRVTRRRPARRARPLLQRHDRIAPASPPDQQEKERLQNELSIAQEVQANLFPRTALQPALARAPRHLPSRPLRQRRLLRLPPLPQEATDGQPQPRTESGVGIALGDISGKGISAALLMATLHSAVRAYRFASEELVYSRLPLAGLTASRDKTGPNAGECAELFESPGRILSLLNRHLYRSTQPEKYATLFLAHYDAQPLAHLLQRRPAPAAGPQPRRQHPPSRQGRHRRRPDGRHVLRGGPLPMTSGDILVAYSDGVTEPENDFGEFGEDRLMEVVPATATNPSTSSPHRSCSPSTLGSAPKSNPTTSPSSSPVNGNSSRTS